ncbi:hypothetical protein SVIOM342S_00523 [Streptomyces violaceorubidus]
MRTGTTSTSTTIRTGIRIATARHPSASDRRAGSPCPRCGTAPGAFSRSTMPVKTPRKPIRIP